MSTTRSAKPVKPTAKAIANNRLRRSRSEGTMVYMSSTSYPHAILGNSVDLISGGNEKVIRRAINTERDMRLLEYIRQVALFVQAGKVVFNCDSVKLETDVTKARALKIPPTTCFEYIDSKIHDPAGLISMLLTYFHSTQVRAMTRKYPLDKGTWEIRRASLNIDKEAKGLSSLNMQVDIEQLTLDETRDLLVNHLSEDDASIRFMSDAITVSSGMQSLSINYVFS